MLLIKNDSNNKTWAGKLIKHLDALLLFTCVGGVRWGRNAEARDAEVADH